MRTFTVTIQTRKRATRQGFKARKFKAEGETARTAESKALHAAILEGYEVGSVLSVEPR